MNEDYRHIIEQVGDSILNGEANVVDERTLEQRLIDSNPSISEIKESINISLINLEEAIGLNSQLVISNNVRIVRSYLRSVKSLDIDTYNSMLSDIKERFPELF